MRYRIGLLIVLLFCLSSLMPVWVGAIITIVLAVTMPTNVWAGMAVLAGIVEDVLRLRTIGPTSLVLLVAAVLSALLASRLGRFSLLAMLGMVMFLEAAGDWINSGQVIPSHLALAMALAAAIYVIWRWRQVDPAVYLKR